MGGGLLAGASYFVAFLFAANASNDTGVRIALSCVVGVLGRQVIVPVFQSYRTAKAAQRGLKEVVEKRRALSIDPGARDTDETCTQRRASERMKAVAKGDLEIAPLGLQEGARNEGEKKLEQPDGNLEPNVKTGNDDDREGDKEIPVLEQGDAALARPEQEHAAEGRRELEQPDAKREPSVKQQVKVKKKKNKKTIEEDEAPAKLQKQKKKQNKKADDGQQHGKKENTLASNKKAVASVDSLA